MNNSVNNYNINKTQQPSQETNTKPVQNNYDAQKIDKSIFNINDKSLTGTSKEIWDKNFKDLDGDGNVSVGDFTNEELSLSNGHKTFKDYLDGIMGKSWKVAEHIITNIKAMFIKSMPNTEKSSQSNAKEITNYIKNNKLKTGDTFEMDGVKYTVGYNGTVIAQADDYESKTQKFEDGKTSVTTNLGEQLNTTVTDTNGNRITERNDYDDGSAHIKVYNNGEPQTDITIRAPKNDEDIPFIRIKE